MALRRRSGGSATSLLLGLVTALGGLAATTTPAAAEEAQEEVVVATTFEDGSWSPWVASGGPTLSVVDVDGGKALRVDGRTNDWDGVQTPAGLLEPGGTYRLSMRARLAEGTTGPAGVRFVVKPSYTWVGNTSMTADAWTAVSGTVTVPAGADPAALGVYLGTADLGAPYSYLVDDLTITRLTSTGGDWQPTPDPTFVPGGAVDPTETPRAAARGTGQVAALTFDDGPNPGETDRLLDVLAQHDVTATFCVIGQNIEAPGGAELLRRIVADGHTLCNHGTSYADMGSWSHTQVEADLKATLATIRAALGDPEQQVPYFRAPNGSWGVTGEVAAALGMQPLGLGNVIFDWDGNDLSEATLTENLRAAIQPGAVALVHDGGGNRENSVNAVATVLPEKLAEGFTFTLPVGGVPAGGEGGEVVHSTSFEDGLDGWGPRGDAEGDPTVAVTTTEAHTGAQAALVSGRTSQGDGLARDMTGVLQEGVTYEISAWVKFAPGQPTDDVWLSMQRTSGGADSFDTVGQFTGVGSGSWTQVSATYQVPSHEALRLYFETRYPDGSAGSFLVDDVVVRSQARPEVEDLTPLQDTVPFPVGAAIDERETSGAAAELLTRHFGQVTPENHMKPEAWYAADRTFTPHPQADALMRFAQEEDLGVYGHTLVWHSQTPAWFFQRADGTPLTTSETDRQVLRDRMRTHVFAVAEHLATTYGAFGSATNPLVAFDVVNEVVSDGSEHADGMRRSEWYRVLGEEFVDLAFRYADEAFNQLHAAPGADRPVTLFINDYNTEQGGKQQRLRALVERLLARGVPVDGVGHQFHVSLSMPVSALEQAITAFADLPVTQAVTELDVTVGTPVTQANLVEQGYYYRDAFRVFREHAERIFSVTVWGLTDGRSWRSSSGAPLLFDDALKAKPAYHGAADGTLPGRQRSALVFRGDVPLKRGAARAAEWSRLPLHRVEQVAGFQLRWAPDHLTAYVRVTDATRQAADGVQLVLDGTTYRVGRDGAGDVPAVVEEVDGGYVVVATVPAGPLAEGDRLGLDVLVTDGDTSTGWTSDGTAGTLTLVEPLSATAVQRAKSAPTVDGAVEKAWRSAEPIATGTQVLGTGGASAAVRTLWEGDTLYVLAEVTDAELDASGSDPWVQDSVELFLDAGNVRNGPYRYDDMQVRISYRNVLSFGTGDEAFQAGRVRTATRTVPGGYVVEAAIDLLEAGGRGTFHGFDVQVNDASGGVRTAVRTWADPTGNGYQSTSRWGVAQLVR